MVHVYAMIKVVKLKMGQILCVKSNFSEIQCHIYIYNTFTIPMTMCRSVSKPTEGLIFQDRNVTKVWCTPMHYIAQVWLGTYCVLKENS